MSNEQNHNTVSEKFLDIAPAWMNARKAYSESFKTAQKSALDALNKQRAEAWKSVREAVSHE